MIIQKHYALTFVISILLLMFATLFSSKVNAEPIQSGTVIYKVLQGQSPSDLKAFNALIRSQGLVSERTLDGSGITIATFDQIGREIAIANILKHSGHVEFAEPDYAVEPSLEPNDPSYPNQWHHQTINSPQAWENTTGSNSVLVGVCDTGFDVNHPDLAPNLRTDLAFNAQDGSNNIFDANGHGTGTAGVIGAIGNNATGVSGVNWDVDIIPVRIAISDDNSSAYISTMATCIEYSADQGARVVNLSYGGIQYSTIDSAAQYLRSKNGLLFMSAGNDGAEFPDYPDYTSFIGVGATDQNNNRASFSNYGTYVDLTAPGVSILTTYPNNRYVNYSGTSFSSPMAAGVAALMVSANPTITPDEIENGLFSTATDIGTSGDDNVFGHGLINAQDAVGHALSLGNFTAPVAEISTSANTVPFGTAITFSAANSYDADGSITSYQWNLGDGTTSNTTKITHTFTEAGSYQASLTVTDNDALTNSATVTVQVTNDIPVAVIDAMPTDYNIGDTIFFVGSSSNDNDGNIVTYEWDFGDGQTTIGETVEYAYQSGGNYTAILTVTDNAGAMNTASVDLTISDPFLLLAPSNLTATVNGAEVTLNWQDNSINESNFVIERGVKYRGKTTFTTLVTLSADSTGYIDTVTETGDYTYRVKAVNAQSEAVSNEVKVTVNDTSTSTNPEPGTMITPSNLTAIQSGNNVVLNWTDNSSDELGFTIERGQKVKGSIEFTVIGTIDADVTSFSDDVSSLSGNYAYRIIAFKDDDTSDYSNTAELRIK